MIGQTASCLAWAGVKYDFTMYFIEIVNWNSLNKV